MSKTFQRPAIPRNIPMHEMQMIIGGREQGMTQKAIKQVIDQTRQMRGTYTGKGISTNTISRMLGATHKAAFKQATKEAWRIYAKRTSQHSQIERVADQIKDPKERKRFMKFARQQTERQKGRQYNLEVGYEAETDEYYVISP